MLPDFLIAGAAKAGTTALYEYLKQHPQVFMNEDKETNFFAFEGTEVDFRGPEDDRFAKSVITNLRDYEKEFEGAKKPGIKAVGESSPWYLYSEFAAENIRRHAPEMKIILILRDPVERTYSSYLHVIRDGREKLSLREGLFFEDRRVSEGWEYIWHYRRVGLYAGQVKRYLKNFPKDQIKIVVYEDFRDDPRHTLSDLHKFLEIDDFAADLSIKPNATGIPKSKVLGKLLLQRNFVKSTVRRFVPKHVRAEMYHKINQRLVKKPPLEEEIRANLASLFEEDIAELETLLDRDLSVWREKNLRRVS